MAEQRPRMRRRSRWPRRLLVGLLVLLLILIVLVQIFLWTDYPRRIAIAQLQRQLGVQATMKSLSISWLGNTRAQDLKITVPMTGGPLLQAKSVHIKHTSLPLIAFSQDVKRITVEGLEVDIREQLGGQWNIQLISPQKKEDAKPKNALDLPDLQIRDAIVRVVKRDGRKAEVLGVSFSGKQSKPLEYTLKANVGDSITADGKMSLTGELQHELALKVSSVPRGIEQFVKLPEPLSGELRWTGRRDPDGVAGRLDLRSGMFANFRAGGEGVVFTTAQKQLVFEPLGFTVGTAGETPFDLVLHQGKLIIGEQIKIEQLRGKTDKGRVALDGWLKPATLDGNLDIAWEDVSRAKLLLCTGRLSLQTRRAFTGNLVIDGHASSAFELQAGKTTAEMKFHGETHPDRTLDASFETMPLAWTKPDGSTIAVPSITGSIRSQGDKLVLQSLRPVDSSRGEMRAHGEIDLKKKAWWASLDSSKLDLSNMNFKPIRFPIDLNVVAAGTYTRVDVKQFYFRHGKAVMWSNGFFDSAIPEPLNLNTWVWYEPIKNADDDAEFTGMHAHATIVGTLEPQNIHAEGVVAANDLSIAGFKIGDVSVNLRADKTDDVARIRSRDIDLLGGTWSLRGDWRAFTDQPLRVVARWKNVPLEQLGDLVKVPGMSGMVESGEATFHLPSARVKDAKMEAHTIARGVKFQSLQAESADIKAELNAGKFVATSVLKQGEGAINSTLTLDLPRVREIKMEAKLDKWTAPTFGEAAWMKDLRGILNGNATVTFARPDRRLDVDTTIAGQIHRNEKTVGDIDVHATMVNSNLELRRARITTLDGLATAQGSIDLRNFNSADLEVYFSRLMPSELAWIRPELSDVSGRLTGSLLVHPSPSRRDLGPVEILLTVRPEDAYFRTIRLGPINLAAYGDYRAPNDFRLVTDMAEINIAEGMIKPFARLSFEPTRGLSQLLTAELHRLNLEPIVRAFKDDGKPVIGRVSGNLNVFGATTSLRGISGEATVKLTDSDLGNFGPIAVLYDAMSVGKAGKAPQGTGDISLRLEQATLTIVNAVYFNRGVWANGFGKIDDIDNEGKNDYTILGSVRLLKAIPLPIFGDADALLSAFQSGVTAVYVSGPMRDPQTKMVALSELSDSLRAIVLGKAKEDR